MQCGPLVPLQMGILQLVPSGPLDPLHFGSLQFVPFGPLVPSHSGKVLISFSLTFDDYTKAKRVAKTIIEAFIFVNIIFYIINNSVDFIIYN